jgi:hypothetical protein
MSLFFSLMFRGYATSWPAALAGIFLATTFLQLAAMTAALSIQTLRQYAYTWLRTVLLWLAAGLLLSFVIGMGVAIAETGSVKEAAAMVRGNPVGAVVLFPFDVFGHVLTAESFVPGLIGWGAAALAIDLGLLGLAMWLDVNFLEASIAVSQKIYQRTQRIRSGAGWSAAATSRGKLPMLPWLGGAGPIARNQLLKLVRGSPRLIIFVVLMGVAICVPAILSRHAGADVTGFFAMQMGMITLMVVRTLPFDFRGDLDHLEQLKSLPLSAAAITVGELFGPVLLLTALHVASVLVAAAFLESGRTVLFAIAAFALPFNWLLFGVENFFFLLFPSRVTPGAAGSFQFFGRMIVESLVRALVLGMLMGIAALFGWVVYLLAGDSWPAALLAAWAWLAMEATLAIPCVAWAFRRFDVSVNTPL